MTDPVDNSLGEVASPTANRWSKLQELFARAVDLPLADQAAFVEVNCGDDATLRAELLALLASDSNEASPLTNALGTAISETSRQRRQALVGTIVGAYKLTSVLGHGGAGTVYLAERADRQYSAQVAVKIVESAALHPDLGLRFKAERQILASLNHPNIARLVDAGETAEGSPYLVMEYVHGESIDKYSNRQRLSVEDRLELFLKVCGAVQYAHQNLIVHRDLKPANILVTAEGTPKLLDFGIAKLLDNREAVAMLALTRMNDRLLTPEYASPEQILGRPVTTASDVYALGIVLYELLTGLPPYTVSDASQLELERSICITDPPKPSQAARRALEGTEGSSRPDAKALAEARSTTAERLQRRLSGDLDSIVLRALRKEPEQRYGSADQLAADIRRYLAKEPVVARQGNWVYYARRFTRRHAFGVVATATFVALLSASAIMTSLQARRIAAERDNATREGQRAETVSTFLLDVFAAADPFTTQGREITARELLDQAAQRIQGDLNQQPEVRARLLETIGRAYRRQGQIDRAVAYLEDAVRIKRSTADATTPKLALTLVDLAMALREQGNFEKSKQAFAEALQILKTRGNERTPEYAELLAEFGRMELAWGELDKAQSHLEAGLVLMRDLRGPRNAEVGAILNNLTNLLMWKNENVAAERTAREAVSIFEMTLPELHPDRIVSEKMLGDVLLREKKIDEAGTILERNMRAAKLLYSGGNTVTAAIQDALAIVKTSQGHLADAETLEREALATMEQSVGQKHYMAGYFHVALGEVLTKRKKLGEAESEVRTALAIFEKSLPPDHQYVASAEHHLGEILLLSRRVTDAEATLTAATDRWRRTNAPAWLAARSQSLLGEAKAELGKPQEAERYLTESYRILLAQRGKDDEDTRQAYQRLEHFYAARGETRKMNDIAVATN